MTVDERLAALEQKVAELEAAQGDQLTPGAFSLNAAGELEEILTGKLQARGIIIPEGTAGEEGVVFNELIWQDLGGTIQELITGFVIPAEGQHNLALQAGAGGSTHLAGLNVRGGAPGAEQPRVDARAGLASATIIENGGKSSFLLLAGGPASRRIAFGSAIATWSAKGFSGRATIVPGFTVLVPMAIPFFNAESRVSAQLQNVEAKQFDVVISLEIELALGAEAAFYWMCIGE